jgi:hypothetical protein
MRISLKQKTCDMPEYHNLFRALKTFDYSGCHKYVPLLDQPDVDIWFADESGFEGDPRPRKRWDKKRIN